MNQEKIGKLIAKCRKEKNLTQEQLAEKLGISAKSVSRWENGKTLPDYAVIEDLTKLLDISINEFFYGERISQNEREHISEENLLHMFKERYGMMIKRKFVMLSGVMGTFIGILIYMLFFVR